jgi:transposase InsO family protein
LFIRCRLEKLVVADRQQPEPRPRMNIHKNARTTPYSRLLMARRVDAGERVTKVAAAFCVSDQTVRKWVRRWRAGGGAALQDRSSRPQRLRNTAAQTVATIERLRRQRASSPAIARELGLPISTVTKILCRLGLNRLKALDPPVPVVRYQRARPGELVHIDTKKLGRIAGIGHRITGRQPGAVNRHHGIGWECLHVCIDDACRLAYSEILPDERKESATAFLERALAWFARHGVTVERVMTDNGSCYLSQSFRQTCLRHAIRHLRTRPYRPRTNGKAERFIQTSLREWAYAQPYASSQQRSVALTTWLDHYNTARPHTALGDGPPAAWLRQYQLLCSTQGTVASSRPASTNDHSGGPGQGSPKATGASRRAACCVSDMSDSSGGASPLCNLMEVKH